MPRVLIWDLPTRLFHWLLASGFSIAAVIALLLGDDSPLFPYHSIIGLSLALMVGLRLLWGVAGTRFARFTSFALGPRAVLSYLSGVARGTGPRHIGHNPASAYAILAMLGLIIALAVTGIMMGTGNQGVKEIHEFLAYAMLAVVGTHVLGVIVHTIRFKENITANMFHGLKSGDPSLAIRSARPIVAGMFLVVIGAWTLSLLVRYDPTSQQTTLPILGTRITLGESENESKRSDLREVEREQDDD